MKPSTIDLKERMMYRRYKTENAVMLAIFAAIVAILFIALAIFFL